MLVPFEFQQEYIDKLTNSIEYFVESKSKNTKILFHAPTGSGKTYMCSQVIQNLQSHFKDAEKLVFLWLSISHGELEKQTYKKFNDYGMNHLKLFGQEYLSLEHLDVLCAGWSTLKSKSKVGDEKVVTYKKGSEKSLSLENQIKSLRDDGFEFVVFVDESHHTSESDLSKEIIELIKPKVKIDVSATPKDDNDYQESIKIDGDVARKSGIVKQAIVINADLEKNEYISERLLLNRAKDKRELIKQKFFERSLKINPLVLIQLKNETWEEVRDSLLQIGIFADQIGVWLNDAKINIDKLSDIVEDNHPISYVICNQAIATGWDCPRAHILVQMLKASEDFSTQVIGRILRTVERKIYHDDDLDNGFVYTILNKEAVEEIKDKAKTIHTVQYEVEPNPDLKINLVELNEDFKIFSKEILTKPSEQFVFIDHYNELKGKIGSKIKNKMTTLKNIADLEIELKSGMIQTNAIDAMNIENEKIQNKKIDMSMMEKYVVSTMEIPSMLFRELQKSAAIHGVKISKDLIEIGKKAIKDVMNDNKKMKVEPFAFQKNYKVNTSEQGATYKKTLYTHEGKFYQAKPFSEPERIMVNKLENSSKVIWWFKNFDNGRYGYSLVFKENNEEKLHYPDFIIKTNEGMLFIETKIKSKQELEHITNNEKYEQCSVRKNMDYKMIFVDTKKEELFEKTGASSQDISLYKI